MPTPDSSPLGQNGAPLVGVLGGMGPAASADFLLRLVRLTPADRDQDHLPVIMYANPATPDRSDALMGVGLSPLQHLTDGVRFLDLCGANVIVVPCNSAHAWYSDLQAASSVPILHIAEAAVETITYALPDGGRIGLLATEGTLRLGFYQQRIEAAGYTPVVPQSAADVDVVMRAIRSLKAGSIQEADSLMSEAVDRLLSRGADRIIIGCTDLSAALGASRRFEDEWLIDAADALARTCVAMLLPGRV